MTIKVTTALLITGAAIITGCQSIPQSAGSVKQEVLAPSVCIAEPLPVDGNGNPMPVDLIDTLSMELRVFFDKDNAKLKDKYTSELNKIIEFADRCSNLTFFVQGHTSKIEQQAVNDKNLPSKGSSQQFPSFSLAGARAQSIKEYLININLPANRIRTFACGADSPIASNDTEEGANMNQRVYGWMSVYKEYSSTPLNCREF